MDNVSDGDDRTMLWGNLATAVAYFVITSQLLLFVYNPKVVRIFYPVDDAKDSKKRRIFRLLLAIAVLFASFICLCGTGHLMNVLVAIYPGYGSVKQGQAIVMWLTAIVSFFTAIVGFPLFPAIASAVEGLELTSEGKLQHAGTYLIEVVDLIKESILVLSEDLNVKKCNDVSKLLFGADVVGTNICEYIYPADLSLFNDVIMQTAESYSLGSTTVEVRVFQNSPSTGSPKANMQRHVKQSSDQYRRKGKKYRVHSTEVPPFELDGDLEMVETTPLNADRSSDHGGDTFLWIEVTVCKGKLVRSDGTFEYDIKLVCRNIDDRKKRQAFQALVESTEERGRINEAKLRYVSCIAHDLKTPLQSFTFSLDLLGNTELLPEQREFIEHATVAIDLMKLTISQTMDISKALTGAKLMPRRSTVFLSSVLHRVKIIISGYSKQVPVSFEVAPDVCDEIITDEEWLWQMLLNLLTNACKYTDRGSIQIRVSVVIDNNESTVQRMGSFAHAHAQALPSLKIPKATPYMLLCEVLDTGVGISPNKMEHIFDAFAQVQEGQVTGTGLGLFGVRTRAEGLLGTCGARHNTESSTGTGTVLWFAIPYVPNLDFSYSPKSLSGSAEQGPPLALPAFLSLQVAHVHEFSTRNGGNAASPLVSIHRPPEEEVTVHLAHMHPPVVKNETKAPLMRQLSTLAVNQNTAEPLIRALKLTAMVVEDTPTVRKLMQKLLLSMGFERVDCYENGSRGLQAMMTAQVDIVFSDVQMPIMTGPEMVRRFRIWEASVAVQPSPNSPSRSVGAEAGSTSTSFISTYENSDDLYFAHAAVSTTEVRKRQLIVAVTANSAECERDNQGGFDEICSKPLTRADIRKVIARNFQHTLESMGE